MNIILILLLFFIVFYFYKYKYITEHYFQYPNYSHNTASTTGYSTTNHNDKTDLYNFEPIKVINNFVIPADYNDPNLIKTNNTMDELTFGSFKQILNDTKKILNNSKNSVNINKYTLTKINVPIEQYSNIISYILKTISTLCAKSYVLKLKKILSPSTYEDNDNTKIINITFNIIIIHPFDALYNKNNLDVFINVTILVDKNNNIYIRDLYVE